MNQLPTDTILYLLDFMIVPASEFINLFKLNRHWKESTEENPEFWLRQLAGLFFMICKEKVQQNKKETTTTVPGASSTTENHQNILEFSSPKEELNNFSIEGLNYFQFYCKFFCNKKGMHYLMQHQPVLKKIFKKLAHFLQIIELRERNEAIEDFTLIKKTFIDLHSNIKSELKTKFQKEKLDMLNSTFFNYFHQFTFFAIDEYGMNKEIITSKKEAIALSHFELYWKYLLTFTRDELEEEKGLELLQLFLDNNIYSKMYFIRKVATLFLQCSQVTALNEIQERYQEKSLQLVFNLLKRYFQTSIGNNVTAKYEKAEELLSYIVFDQYEDTDCDFQLKVLDGFKATILPTLKLKGFEQKIKELKILWKPLDKLRWIRNANCERILSYVLDNFHCDDPMIEFILKQTPDTNLIQVVYKQTRRIYSKVPDLKLYLVGRGGGIDESTSHFENIISLIEKHYEMDGKDKRQLVKDFEKSTHPFITILSSEGDDERMKGKIRLIFELYSQYFTKEQVKAFLKIAYFKSFGKLGTAHSVQVTKFFIEEYQLSPADCFECGSTLDERIFNNFYEESETAVKSFPIKWFPKVLNVKEFKMHPIVNYFLCEIHPGNLDGFIEICGEDRVVIPLLLDWNGTSKDVKQAVYIDYLDRKKLDRKYRFVLKYVTLKDLIKDDNFKPFY